MAFVPRTAGERHEPLCSGEAAYVSAAGQPQIVSSAAARLQITATGAATCVPNPVCCTGCMIPPPREKYVPPVEYTPFDA